MWAFLDEAATATEFTGRRIAESAKLRDQLLGMQGRPGGSLDEVAEFRALLNRGAATEPQEADLGLDEMMAATSSRIEGADDSLPETPDGTSPGS